MNKLLYILSMLLIPVFQVSAASVPANDAVTGIRQLNGTTVEVVYNDGKCLTLDFYSNNIFRMFQDNAGGIVREPESTPPAKILVQNPRKNVDKLRVTTTDADVSVSTGTIRVDISRSQGLMRVTDLRTGRQVMAESQPVSFKRSKYTVSLSEQPDEYFYGGGVQNGRFSHRGHKIEIVNTNSWTDGGVASPAPFYWSTAGYAVMGYTFAPGLYDFGATAKGVVTLTHDANYLDMFVMVDAEPVSLLNDYYQLTGNPVLLPKFAFYEGHLNAYNRDYWKETTEAGKPIRDARGEIGRAYQTLILSAEEAKRLTGEMVPIQGAPGCGNRMAYTKRQPLGVVCAITPFNFPVNLACHKLGPALAAGNTVVYKPASATPLTAVLLCEVFQQAGLPAGCLNLVMGPGALVGDLLAKDERIRMFSFTGSVPVGKSLQKSAGFRRVALELGSNSANIVHGDVKDVKEVAELCARYAFTNAGQVCISCQRVYVERPIYEKFCLAAKAYAQTLETGDLMQETTTLGPMIAEKEAVRIEAWVKEACEDGAKLLTGGTLLGS